MERPQIHDVLASRYASSAMLKLWTDESKIVTERTLWVAILEAQMKFGVTKHVPSETISAYQSAIETVNLESIRKRELKNGHDVKARIEEFNALAGYEHIHEGMTSRDLTDNIEQWQVLRSMELIEMKLVAILHRLQKRALEFQNTPLAGRSHNVPGQVTTVGKRFASWAEELLCAYHKFTHMMQNYPLRGIKGPMGTSQDMLDLLGTSENVHALEEAVRKSLGFNAAFLSVGQVYPRTLDFDVLSNLVQIGAVASTFATTLRLMAGAELAAEGFKEGQVGSSAMPHKMNARSSERICGFYNVLRGFLTMIEGPAGAQWNEGDVSCSVVRRVALSGAFFAIDGALETWMTVLDSLGVYESMVERELERNLPFLATTKILMAAIKAGMTREEAHNDIKRHATFAVNDLRKTGKHSFFESLGNDFDFILSTEEIQRHIGSPLSFAGLAAEQVQSVVKQIEAVCEGNFEATNYQPEPIL